MKGADCGPGGLQDLKSKKSNELLFPVAQLKQGKHGLPTRRPSAAAAAGCDFRGWLEGL